MQILLKKYFSSLKLMSLKKFKNWEEQIERFCRNKKEMKRTNFDQSNTSITVKVSNWYLYKVLPMIL